MTCACHGDDFSIVGFDWDLRWIIELMKTWFAIKVRAILGPESNDDKEVTILGRVVRWKSWGIECEADPRHREILMEHFGLNGASKSLSNNNLTLE